MSINSAAVRDPELVQRAARRFGSQCIVVNIDPKRVRRDGREIWEVHINGGRVPTGREAVAWAREVEELGAGEIVLTSMDADGTKNGYDLEMTRRRGRRGGSSRSWPRAARATPSTCGPFWPTPGASAALAASIFHYRHYSISETKEYLSRRGVPVRLVDTARSSRRSALPRARASRVVGRASVRRIRVQPSRSTASSRDRGQRRQTVVVFKSY